MNPLYLLIALAAGAGVAAQAAINARMGAGVGGQPVAAALGAAGLALLALVQVDWGALFAQAARTPWWSWIGGLIGAVFVLTSVFLTPRLGVANTVFLFVLGQLAAGMVIDGLGLFQMQARTLDWWKFAGLAVMLGGLGLFMFGDRLFGRG